LFVFVSLDKESVVTDNTLSSPTLFNDDVDVTVYTDVGSVSPVTVSFTDT